MSWDSYCDNLKLAGLANAAIVGTNGQIWSQSAEMNLLQPEAENFGKRFDDKDFWSTNGLRIGAEKYLFIQSDSTQIQGRKGQNGCSLAKAKSCILIGLYKEGMAPGTARCAVEKLRDYLLSVGY